MRCFKCLQFFASYALFFVTIAGTGLPICRDCKDHWDPGADLPEISRSVRIINGVGTAYISGASDSTFTFGK